MHSSAETKNPRWTNARKNPSQTSNYECSRKILFWKWWTNGLYTLYKFVLYERSGTYLQQVLNQVDWNLFTSQEIHQKHVKSEWTTYIPILLSTVYVQIVHRIIENMSCIVWVTLWARCGFILHILCFKFSLKSNFISKYVT